MIPMIPLSRVSIKSLKTLKCFQNKDITIIAMGLVGYISLYTGFDALDLKKESIMSVECLGYRGTLKYWSCLPS